MLEGGYKYSKKRDGSRSDKPVEDLFFADIACAWRYAAENYVKWGVAWEDQKKLRQETLLAERRREIANAQRIPTGWMDLPAESPELAELLLT